METEQLRERKRLQKENERLRRRAVSDLTPDMLILAEAAKENIFSQTRYGYWNRMRACETQSRVGTGPQRPTRMRPPYGQIPGRVSPTA